MGHYRSVVAVRGLRGDLRAPWTRGGALHVSLSLVLDVDDVAGVGIDAVVDDLHSAVSHEDVVGAAGVVAVPGLLLTEVVAALLVLDSVRKVVFGRLLRKTVTSSSKTIFDSAYRTKMSFGLTCVQIFKGISRRRRKKSFLPSR